jgi:hypothetical protein
MRRLASVLVALVCAAGLSVVGGGSAYASVVPVHGVYDGVDHHGRIVSFRSTGPRSTTSRSAT